MTSDPAHVDPEPGKPAAWPDGTVPFNVSKATPDQAENAKQAMPLWTDTGANTTFVPRTTETEHICFTGKTVTGNNTTFTGFPRGSRLYVSITVSWWRQGPWMPAHESGQALGFHHEHRRGDRDTHVTTHHEHLTSGREPGHHWDPDYRWIVVTPNDGCLSIRHSRACWASKGESEGNDRFGTSPSAVIDPVGEGFDKATGRWTVDGQHEQPG